MTLRKLARWIVGVPFLLLMILFALSNTTSVRLGLFPTDISIEVPVSVAILAALAIGFFLGGLRLWFTARHHRRRAQQAEDAARLLAMKHAELTARAAAGRSP